MKPTFIFNLGPSRNESLGHTDDDIKPSELVNFSVGFRSLNYIYLGKRRAFPDLLLQASQGGAELTGQRHL